MKRINPFWKYVKCETKLQVDVTQYLQWQYPTARYHHSPNEAKRSPFEQFLMKIMGVKRGFPDLLIYFESGVCLALELKYENNVPSEGQKEWLKFYNNIENSFGAVSWTYESAKRIIDSAAGYSKNNGFVPPLTRNLEDSYWVDSNDLIPKKLLKLLKLKEGK